MTRPEKEIRDKIADSLKALEDFSRKTEVEPEDFFTVARQATYMTALYWVLGEDIPENVKKLAVPIIKKMSEAQAAQATQAARKPAPEKKGAGARPKKK